MNTLKLNNEIIMWDKTLDHEPPDFARHVVLQKSIPAQIRQLIFYISNSKG